MNDNGTSLTGTLTIRSETFVVTQSTLATQATLIAPVATPSTVGFGATAAPLYPTVAAPTVP